MTVWNQKLTCAQSKDFFLYGFSLLQKYLGLGFHQEKSVSEAFSMGKMGSRCSSSMRSGWIWLLYVHWTVTSVSPWVSYFHRLLSRLHLGPPSPVWSLHLCSCSVCRLNAGYKLLACLGEIFILGWQAFIIRDDLDYDLTPDLWFAVLLIETDIKQKRLPKNVVPSSVDSWLIDARLWRASVKPSVCAILQESRCRWWAREE